MNWNRLYVRMARLDGKDAEKAFEEFFVVETPLVRARFLQWGYAADMAEALAFQFVREIALMAPFVRNEVRQHGFKAWVNVITRDTFLEYWKRQSKLTLPLDDWPQLAREIDGAITRLSPLQRSLVLLFSTVAPPKTYAEAAALLNIPSTVAMVEHKKALHILEANLSATAKRLLQESPHE